MMNLRHDMFKRFFYVPNHVPIKQSTLRCIRLVGVFQKLSAHPFWYLEPGLWSTNEIYKAAP